MVFKSKFHLCLSPDSTGRGADRNLLWGAGVGSGCASDRNLLSRFGAGEGGVGHGEVGWESGEMGPGEEIFGVFGWVERRKASQPIGFSDEGRIGKRSAVPMFFWQRDS